jgi:hypothetical protein
MAKILIAGLPGAGKSTYIGALAYTLEHPVNKQVYTMSETPDDTTIIKKLYRPWLCQKPVDRTVAGNGNNIDLRVKKGDTIIDLSLPDIVGEDFESLLKGQSNVLESWCENAEGLLFMIKDFPGDTLTEAVTEGGANQQITAAFDIKETSPQVKNIVLFKELCRQFKFKKIAIAISAWDSKGATCPEEYLKNYFPVFYNYISHNYSSILIFGLSAQGDAYKEENRADIEERTTKGTRAYIVYDKETKYDLSIPISFLV